jgi:hypothetical protein
MSARELTRVETNGVPLGLYTDWKDVYVREPTAEEQATGRCQTSLNKNSLLRRPDLTAGFRQTSLALRHNVPARVSPIRQTLARG